MNCPSLVVSLLPAVLILSARAAPAAEDGGPVASLVGGDSIAGKLEAVSADGTLRFTTPSGERTVDIDRLVRWGNPVEAESGRAIVLGDGSILMAVEWVVRPREQPLLLENASLAFSPILFPSISVPRHLVRGIILQLPTDRKQRDILLYEVHSHTADEDAVLLTGGDRLTGHIEALDGESVSLRTSLGPVEVPLSRVKAVLFDPSLAGSTIDSSERTLVGLADGSILAAGELRGEKDALQMELGGNVMLQAISVADVVSLQPGGGDKTYLSDLEPHRFVHVPYLDLPSPLRRDRNVLGGRLRTGGNMFLKGLGVHSGSRIIYRLAGNHERFAALAAIDDSAGRGGSAIFRVLLAEGEAWREVFTSPVIRGGDEPLPVSVPLGEAKGLALVVDYADRGDELDHADWLDARLE